MCKIVYASSVSKGRIEYLRNLFKSRHNKIICDIEKYFPSEEGGAAEEVGEAEEEGEAEEGRETSPSCGEVGEWDFHPTFNSSSLQTSRMTSFTRPHRPNDAHDLK